jgi:hypothetical protein
MPLSDSTAEAIKKAIQELLAGEATGVNPQTGKTIKSSNSIGNTATTDPFRINPVNNQNTHTDEFSTAKHITTKEKVITYETKGMQQTINVDADEVTELPKFIIKSDDQPNRDLQPSGNEGAVPNQELDVQQAAVPVPTNFSNDQLIQSLVNSLLVTHANAIAEAVINVLRAKIESNQTEFEIEFDPTQQHKIQLVTMAGSVMPGGMGFVSSVNGTVSFKSGTKYKHKAKLKISNL